MIDLASTIGTDSVQRKRVLMWLILSVLAALLGWVGFRGYLNPDLLFHFANSLYC